MSTTAPRRRGGTVSIACLGAALLACGESATPLPCEVDAVLEEKCRLCHGRDPAFGAPMPLVTWEHTQRPAPTDASRRVWEVMEERISDPLNPMPPPGNGTLDDMEHQVLEAWFAAGAPPGEEAPVSGCDPGRDAAAVRLPP